MRSLAAAVVLGAAFAFTPFVHADAITGARVHQVQAKHHHGMKGTISSIDGDSVVVSATNKKTGVAKDHTIKTDTNTKITVDGKDAKVSDLKAGMEVVVKRGAAKGDPASEIAATSASK